MILNKMYKKNIFVHFIPFTFQTQLNIVMLGRQSVHEQHELWPMDETS